MTEAELVKEHCRYFRHIKDGASALPTLLAWTRGSPVAKQAARELWKELDPNMRAAVRALLDET